jgi:hypothetical protein
MGQMKAWLDRLTVLSVLVECIVSSQLSPMQLVNVILDFGAEKVLNQHGLQII